MDVCKAMRMNVNVDTRKYKCYPKLQNQLKQDKI